MNRLNEIFKIISFYDNFRWQNASNYNLINFFQDNIDTDSKLLTHWLCYITDRQMAFKIIWDVGGFVFSEMIEMIKRKDNIELLNPNNSDSFIKKENESNKYFFKSKSDANLLIINNYESYIKNEKVIFKSRFLPSDYFSILYTLICLKKYEYKISQFISDIYKKNINKDNIIKRILFSLYLLSYYDIGQPNSDDIADFNKNIKKAETRRIEIFKILDDEELFDIEFIKFSNDKIFNQKRAWCSLRDFLKSPEFNNYFKISLRICGLSEKDINNLMSINSLNQLELPGDVWNNNSKFRKCILDSNNTKLSLNKILRNHFNENKNTIIGYPEQFDITFDFVPRMCENNNCDICPIFQITSPNNFEKICIKNENMFCPVALISCNYKNLCVGEKKCILFNK